MSVMKPGVSRRTPPINIQIPSKTASPGILPFRSCAWAFRIVCKPSLFAKYAPITPVKSMSSNVGQTPIVFPEKRSNPISAAGIVIIKIIKYRIEGLLLIGLIPLYRYGYLIENSLIICESFLFSFLSNYAIQLIKFVDFISWNNFTIFWHLIGVKPTGI